MYEQHDTPGIAPNVDQPVANVHEVTEGSLPVSEDVVEELKLNANGDADWHAEAGRKGAKRIHQLIQAGRLYEQERGLKSGRQRLRQLIELGKLYEAERGLSREPVKRRTRLSATERENVLNTLLNCLAKIAKPSFRPQLDRLLEALKGGEAKGNNEEQAA